jgi:hypothetical protein
MLKVPITIRVWARVFQSGSVIEIDSVLIT